MSIFLVILIAAAVLVALVATVRALRVDGYRRSDRPAAAGGHDPAALA